MGNRLKSHCEDILVQHPLRILTVFEAGRHRDLVRQCCAMLAPASAVVDVSSATDAVLALLTERVDMLLIDGGLAGDLLGALKRHARRSSPHARLAVFGHTALPWSELVSTLERWLLAP